MMLSYQTVIEQIFTWEIIQNSDTRLQTWSSQIFHVYANKDVLKG